MSVEYVHQQLGEEVTALAGFYALLKESRLKHNGREILCITGMCSVESSCCGRRSFYYAMVPGYVVTWKGKKSEAGLPVSEVEPLTDEPTKREIAATIRETEGILEPSIDFW